MKLISFAIPCYNAASWMRRCVDSLLACADGVEILIVNDGSTDGTGAIADGYQALHPGTVRAFHQPNGGWGEGVNVCLRHADGLYFKVVDSDDWVDGPGLRRLLGLLREFEPAGQPPDLIVCDVVWEYAPAGTHRCVRFDSVLPRGGAFGWADLGRFRFSHFLSLHALLFRTAFLRETAPPLPPHTFYADNLLAYLPLPKVRSAWYADIFLYHYLIGRPGQTIDGPVLAAHAGEHVCVIDTLLNAFDWEALRKEFPRLSGYLGRRVSGMVLLNSFIISADGGTEALRLKKELWTSLRRANLRLYSRLRYRSPCLITFLPGRAGRAVCATFYRVATRLAGLALRLALQKGEPRERALCGGVTSF